MLKNQKILFAHKSGTNRFFNHYKERTNAISRIVYLCFAAMLFSFVLIYLQINQKFFYFSPKLKANISSNVPAIGDRLAVLEEMKDMFPAETEQRHKDFIQKRIDLLGDAYSLSIIFALVGGGLITAITVVINTRNYKHYTPTNYHSAFLHKPTKKDADRMLMGGVILLLIVTPIMIFVNYCGVKSPATYVANPQELLVRSRDLYGYSLTSWVFIWVLQLALYNFNCVRIILVKGVGNEL